MNNVDLIVEKLKQPNNEYTLRFLNPADLSKVSVNPQGVDLDKFKMQGKAPADGRPASTYWIIELRKPNARISDKPVITTVFEKDFDGKKDTYIASGLRNAFEKGIIDIKTGELAVGELLDGYLYEIPLESPVMWHPEKGIPSLKTHQQQFLFAGDSLSSTVKRIQRRFKEMAADPNNKTYMTVTDAPEITDAQQQALDNAENGVG